MRHLTKVIGAGILAASSAPALAASYMPAATASVTASESSVAVQPLGDGLRASPLAMPDISVVDEPIGPMTVSPPNYTIDLVELTPHGAAATAVPEPASWAMMMLGFGALGLVMRHRRSVLARVRLA